MFYILKKEKSVFRSRLVDHVSRGFQVKVSPGFSKPKGNQAPEETRKVRTGRKGKREQKENSC